MRINRHMMFMQMAEAASRRSTCYRRSVGAILVAHNNVISIAYNGPAAGEPHCTGANCPGQSGCARAIHAEVNVIERACAPVEGSRLYTTESPCPDCAGLLIRHRIAEVFYLNEYRLIQGLDLLVLAGVKVFRMTPGGYITDYATNELVKMG